MYLCVLCVLVVLPLHTESFHFNYRPSVRINSYPFCFLDMCLCVCAILCLCIQVYNAKIGGWYEPHIHSVFQVKPV